MKAIIVGIYLLSVSVLLQAQDTFIAATAIVEHPALDAVRDGIQEFLYENGYSEKNLKYTYESAQGQPAIAAQIARKLVGEKPDVIVAIATPSAQAAASAARGTDIPVIFSAVTDPVDAKIVSNIIKPEGNVTGLSDRVNVAQHLILIKEILPDLKRLGVPYNPGEANAVSSIKVLKVAAKAMGIEIVEASAPKSSDVLLASKQLANKVDAIYCITDNTIITALESVVKVGIDSQVPVFAADTDSVQRGAIAAIGFDYHTLGRQTGGMILRVLKGEPISSIPVQVGQGTSLFVNPNMAAKMGVTVPETILKRATKIVE
ncbi:ABC transporter permease [Candidatus Endobugula sertula]|uniref:ABC transporter permease n=1 Tax=Candidatus Endobugula sertula TaxID=62101 RepID=A0A1D2QU57_9GAMM|nr:ABC transporter permease [Candidatus Endobugula sertula]